LALMLHGAGGDARSSLSPFLDLAVKAGLVLLAPAGKISSQSLRLVQGSPNASCKAIK
jgi:hypothetical protein